jgi:hypothetical protein
MAFPQFAELWKLIDLLVRKDFRQANLDKRKLENKMTELFFSEENNEHISRIRGDGH